MSRYALLTSALILSFILPAAAEEQSAPERMRITSVYGGAITNKATFPYGKGQLDKAIKDTGVAAVAGGSHHGEHGCC